MVFIQVGQATKNLLMRHRTKTSTYSTWLKLVKRTNPKTGRNHYSVIVDPYIYHGGYTSLNNSQMAEWRQSLRDHFDPAGNRGMKGALTWKFRNREEAEQLITIALLRWGDRHVA